MKTTNDFLWWLSVNNMIKEYFHDITEACEYNHLLVDDYIKNIDVNNPDYLFKYLIYIDMIFTDMCTHPLEWKEIKEKYINWLNE